MTEVPWSPKDPQEVKDYAFNWSDILLDDAIVSSTWAADGVGLVVDTPAATKTSTTTTFWASAGTDGTTYHITNHITTLGGRTYERTRPLVVKSL